MNHGFIISNICYISGLHNTHIRFWNKNVLHYSRHFITYLYLSTYKKEISTY